MGFAAFCEIGGIPGECSDDGHVDWITVLEYNIGVSQAKSSTGMAGSHTGGTPDFEDFHIVKTIDKSTPELALFCAKGTPIESVIIELCTESGDKNTFMKYELKHVVIRSVQTGGSAKVDEVRPTEHVHFACKTINYCYTSIDTDTGVAGETVERGWNLATNAAL